jgi:hypothetical protein
MDSKRISFFNEKNIWYEIWYEVSVHYKRSYLIWCSYDNSCTCNIKDINKFEFVPVESRHCTYIWVENNGNEYTLPALNIYHPCNIMYQLNKEGMEIRQME